MGRLITRLTGSWRGSSWLAGEDFVVLEGNPLADMTALRRVWMAIKGETTVHRERAQRNQC